MLSPDEYFSEDNWLAPFDAPSKSLAQWLDLQQLKEKLVGELWRERLSSEPSHAAKAAQQQERTGDPMAYWHSFYKMRPGVVSKTWAGQSSIAEALAARIGQIEDQQAPLAQASDVEWKEIVHSKRAEPTLPA